MGFLAGFLIGTGLQLIFIFKRPLDGIILTGVGLGLAIVVINK